MIEKQHPATLVQWMESQARLGVGREMLMRWGLQAGFAQKELADAADVVSARGAFDSVWGSALALAESGQWEQPWGNCLMWMSFPQLALFEGVADERLCEGLISDAIDKVSPSLVSSRSPRLSAARQSASKTFARGESSHADELQNRIAQMLGLPLDRLESLQATRYAQGGFYAPHNDWFAPSHPKWGSPRQRSATIVVYLSSPRLGGQTIIEPLGMRFAPRQGHALYFAYADDVSKEMTLHASAPAEGASKWIAAQWIVEG